MLNTDLFLHIRVKMSTGTGSCGLEVNAADLTGVCARSRVQYLSGLQRRHDAAAAAGNLEVARALSDMILDYEQREGVRLKDVPGV